MTIWKYPLIVTDKQIVAMPAGAKILSVQTQGGVLCLWAMVSPSNPLTDRIIFIFGTGHQIEDAENLAFIGTFQVDGGRFVFHVFEK
jgi:hypothetical protein